MANNLPLTGVSAVVQGVQTFIKDITAVNKAIEKSGKVSNDAAKEAAPLDKELGGLAGKLKSIPPAAVAAVGAITAVVAAVTALVAAFLNLGSRGAPLQEIGVSFDNLTASVGITSQALLKDLRAASEGTIADFELIKTSSTALLGVTGEFGKKFGQALPDFLKIAKVEADATGRSVNELFNNLVEGVKKGTPKLIESTGLIIDQKAAYQEYAATLGITVAQLSDTDKSMALLNATLAAGSVAIDTLGNAQESNADKIDRIQATITNIFDGLAVAIQPVFRSILQGIQRIINGLAQFAPYVALIFNFVGDIISKIVGKIGDSVSDPNFAKRLFEGAAAAFGSFANAIISVANQLIFPAILWIAETIANFLIGFSPPKLGPLSMIDKGGENLMKAWLSGISGVSLDPVIEVANQVSIALGAIGKQGLNAVNARLAKLDSALAPFQNRLEIIKADFDALNEPAKQALDAIERETAKLQEAAYGGDQQAVERLKVLDAQRQTIQDQVDLQQGLVDRAQIQVALAQAQQAPERALLNIRKRYLELLAKSQPVGATGGGLPKEPKAGGAGGVVAPSGGGASGIVTPSGLPSVLDLIGGQDAIEAAAAGVQEAFMGEIDQSGLEQFTQNSLNLGTQIDRIKSVDIGAKISDKFKGLTDAFDPSIAGSIANTVWQFFNGEAINPNSLAGIFERTGASIAPAIETLKLNVQTFLASIFDPTIEGSPAQIVTTFAGDASVPGSAASFFAELPDNIVASIGDLMARINKDVFDPVRKFFTTSDPGSLGDIINQAVGFFMSLPLRIVDALRGIGVAVYNALAVPVINAINGLIGLIESGIRGLINKIAEFATSIADALGDSAPAFLRDTIGKLHDAAAGVNFGRISTELPAFLQSAPLAGATGGIFGKGFMTVGERGTELMYNASKMGVVPHEITNILSMLSGIIAQPQAMPVASNGSTTNNNSSSFNFNGVQSDNDARRRYNFLRAGMR